MDLIERMDISQRVEDILADAGNVWLLQLKLIVALEDVSETASVHVFHRYPQLFVVVDEITVDVLDDVGVIEGLHDKHFCCQKLHVGGLESKLFDRHLFRLLCQFAILSCRFLFSVVR